MKLFKSILIVFFILLLALSAYFLVSKSFFTPTFSAVDVVSKDAIFVFETRDPVTAWNQWVSQPLWERISDIPSVGQLEDRLLAMDSLAGRSGNLQKFLQENDFCLSFHQTGKENFDFLFSIAFSNNANAAFVEALTEKIDSKHIRSRNYSGVSIYEYLSQNGNASLSYALTNNILLASYSSFLIEEAIRHTQSKDLETFNEIHSVLFKSLTKPAGLGVLRLSSTGITRFLSGISHYGERRGLESFGKNKIAANLELKLAEDGILLEGNSFFENREDAASMGEAGGEPNSLFNNYISTRTTAYQQYNLKNVRGILTVTNKGFEPKNTIEGEIERHFKKETFFDGLTGQIGYMTFEESNQPERDRIILLKTNDIDNQISQLKEFSHSLSENEVRTKRDFHRGKEILELAIEEFPAHLFGGRFLDFPRTYVAAYDDILVWANNVRALRLFLNDMYNDNTWGKSISHKAFLESHDGRADFQFVLNLPRSWNGITETSTPEWKALFQKYGSQFMSFDWISLKRNGTATSVEFHYNSEPVRHRTGIDLEESNSVQFSQPLIYGPKVLLNFNDRSSDYLVQDELNQIHLVTESGRAVFSQSVDGEIITDVFQIDYYKNGKLQIIFATANSIYGIDRLGNPLPGYPIAMPLGTSITHLNLVDYEHNLDYRYFLGTASGELYLYDQKGDKLEGWDPRKISAPPAATPSYHRLPGKGDYMTTITTSGDLYLMNRKGEIQTEKAISIGEHVFTNYAVSERNNAAETQIVTINQEGEIIHVNFNGELTFRNQLLRPNVDTQFHLINDQSRDQYLFALHEYNKITVLDPGGNLLFEKSIFSDDLAFQYFHFGAGRNLFVVVDKIQEFIYLYNLKGELLNIRPISGSGKVQVKYSGSHNEYSILAVHGNRLSEYKLPL